jgi:urea ABC transporter ATP-binding protein UrtE
MDNVLAPVLIFIKNQRLKHYRYKNAVKRCEKMLKLSNLSSGYGSTQVLRDINLDVEEGTIVAVLGRNGVGKTTLMKTVVGLLPATSGKLLLGSSSLQDITALPAHQRARRGISYVPQGREIFASLSIRENILTGQHKKNLADSSDISWLLDFFPMLKAKLDNRGDSLSGGQQQQLAIARALVSRPKVLLLDEPSDGIQPSIVQEITEKLAEINRLLGTTIILVEQNLEVVQQLAKKVFIMVKGEIVHGLEPSQLSFENPLLREHLGV